MLFNDFPNKIDLCKNAQLNIAKIVQIAKSRNLGFLPIDFIV